MLPGLKPAKGGSAHDGASFILSAGLLTCCDFLRLHDPQLIEYNLTTWQLKFDWLADHVGCTVSDVARE